MQAYDAQMIGSFYALPAFQKQFGIPVPGKKGAYQVAPKWQSAYCEYRYRDDSGR